MLKLALRSLAVLTALITIIFVVFRTPDIPQEKLRQRYANSHSQFVELPSGVTAHIRDQGAPDAPVLALVHGSNSSLHTWEPWVQELGADFRIITVDLPGHGLTGASPDDDYSRDAMACFLDDVRRALGIERWTLAGNSMGGSVVLASALEHTNHVEALVLVDSGGARPTMPKEPDQGRRGGALAFRLARTPGVNLLTEQFLPRGLLQSTLERSIHDDSLVSEQMVDRYYELLRHPGNRRATRLRMTRARRSELDLERITVPALVMSGREDLIIPFEVSVELDRRLPNSQLVLYPDVGHIPMEEIPEQSAADVREFLTEVLAVGAGEEAADSTL